MRRRYVQIEGKLVEVTDDWSAPVAHEVVAEIQPYKSMVDGTWITSRAKHREHLRRHNCYEVGNETDYLIKSRQKKPMSSPKELIRAQVNQMTESQFKAALKRDIDFVKWNSRGLERNKS